MKRKLYLDGLRGCAALFVVLYHVTQMWGVEAPVLFIPTRAGSIPIRFFFLDGRLAVYVFFALSGYVLSLQFFDSGKRWFVIDQSIRRYPRLTIPLFLYCVVAFIFLKTLQPYVIDASISKSVLVTYKLNSNPDVFYLIKYALFGVYRREGMGEGFSAALWTMPYELQGSFILFAALLAAGNAGILRAIGYSLFLIYGLASAAPFVAMALGMLMAHVSSQKWHIEMSHNGWINGLGKTVLIISIALAMFRSSDETAVLPFCGAGIVCAVLIDKDLQSALSATLPEWLGKISFPMYLIHMIGVFIGEYAFVQLHDKAPFVVWIFTVGLCLILGAAFSPIEQVSITASRAFARVIMRNWTARKA